MRRSLVSLSRPGPLAAAIAFSSWSVALPAAAATITVTTTDDEVNADGDCSLREAVQAADDDAAVDGCGAGSGRDDVVVPAGAYDVSGALRFSDDAAVHASGAALQLLGQSIVVDGAAVLIEGAALSGSGTEVVRALDADLTLRRVDIVAVGGSAGVRSGVTDGSARLAIEESQLRESIVPAVVVEGGDLRVARSTFLNNLAGAIVVDGDAAVDAWSIEQSTFVGNRSDGDGGAVSASYAGTIDHSTFGGNSAVGSGGAVFFAVAGQIKSSILVDNAAAVGANCFVTGGGNVSAGGNVVGDDAGCGFAGDVVGAAAVIGAIGDNGGPTQTALPLGAAVDAGSCVDVAGGVVDRDQRGAAVVDGRCDAGAVEASGRFLEVRVRATALAPGADCARGGTRLDVGADDGAGDLARAGDGVLDDAEVDSSVDVCNTDDAPAVLVDVDDAAVADCADGGIVVASGADDDRDGVLDDGEVDREDVVCNGADGADGADGEDGEDGADGQQGAPGVPGVDGDRGPAGADGEDGNNGGAGVSSLIRTAPVAAGDDGCNAGGQKIEAGIDDGANGGTAGDGVLDDGEVDSTAVLCNGEAFEDEFAASGGPTCASTSATAGLPFALVGLVLRRRRRGRR